MPKTTAVTNVFDLSTLSMFNPQASIDLIKAFNEGKKVEKVESSFSDKGDDYVKFLIEGKEACHINGY